MAHKMKVMTIVGTRPEVIRLSRTICLLDAYVNHILVHTGQNFDFELNQVFFDELKIRRPDYFLDCAGATSSETIGNVIINSDKVLRKEQPDAVLILGDTNSALAAISAKKLKIPVFHVEAGNRCFDSRVPEEINRKIVDHISDINLTYSQIAREYLIAEGFPKDQIIKIGSPIKEIYNFYRPHIEISNILTELKIEKKNYFLVSAHREENVDSAKSLVRILELVRYLTETYMQPVIFSTHPRTRKRIETLNITMPESVRFCKPFGYFDYIKLQLESRCVLSDSGTITEESSILGFHALNIRESHERPEGFEEGAVMLVGLSCDRVSNALSILDSCNLSVGVVNDYDTETVSSKILSAIISYTDYVNRRVWYKG